MPLQALFICSFLYDFKNGPLIEPPCYIPSFLMSWWQRVTIWVNIAFNSIKSSLFYLLLVFVDEAELWWLLRDSYGAQLLLRLLLSWFSSAGISIMIFKNFCDFYYLRYFVKFLAYSVYILICSSYFIQGTQLNIY